MSGRKNLVITLSFVLAVSLTASALTALLAARQFGRSQFELLNDVCGEVLEQDPEAKGIIAAALKEYTGENKDGTEQMDVLASLGYRAADFPAADFGQNSLFAGAGFLAGLLLFLVTLVRRNRVEERRIQALTEYLEQVNTGKAVLLSASGEDVFSKLEDEIYKTVTFLYQTRDAAVEARNDFAANLSNIAHQLKTPITAISLSLETMEQEYDPDKPKQIKRQLTRLTRLEEALLLLSRLDAGVLKLQREQMDVYTVLVLAADNLQEFSKEYGVSVEIPELGEMVLTGDLEWTMEALMNLMKNCMEHHRGGIIHCSYEQNPLYTEIQIRDEGEGFAKEDLPHLFERFYRGKNACEGSIGIGLSLAKEIIERQNGTIRAVNRPEGGASFEIRFYTVTKL